jgi:Uma2 family endonuclease
MATAVLVKSEKVKPVLSNHDVSPFSLRRFTVDEYHKLIEIGVLKSDDPYELLEGWIVRKMPISPAQASTIRKLSALLMARLHPHWVVSIQLPITTQWSEPEPDIVVVEGPLDKYDHRHPAPLESELLIEVSASSLITDRGFKLGIYAAAGVAQYWIVNLIDHRVEVYTLPRSGKKPGYKSCVHYAKGSEIPLVLAKKKLGTLPVSEFLA